AAIRTTPVGSHLLAENPLTQHFVIVLELFLTVLIIFGNGFQQFFLDLADQVVAFRFGMFLGVERIGKLIANALLQIVVISFVKFRGRNLAFGLAGFFAQAVDGGADLFDFGVGKLNRVYHRLFFYFLRARFNHDDGFGRADHHQVEQAFAQFRIRRTHHNLAIHQAYAHCANRALKWNIGNCERGGGAVDGANIGIIFFVGGKHERNHLGLAAEAFREQRAHRAVNHAADENFALAGPAFALNKSAGDASASVGVFTVIHSKREEINSFA